MSPVHSNSWSGNACFRSRFVCEVAHFCELLVFSFFCLLEIDHFIVHSNSWYPRIRAWSKMLIASIWQTIYIRRTSMLFGWPRTEQQWNSDSSKGEHIVSFNYVCQFSRFLTLSLWIFSSSHWCVESYWGFQGKWSQLCRTIHTYDFESFRDTDGHSVCSPEQESSYWPAVTCTSCSHVSC